MPKISQRFPSSDGSLRYLLTLGDASATQHGSEAPARVEAVFMPSQGRQTICISTQAGCAVDCHFCLTAQLGLIRNLTAGEIVGQALVALEEHKGKWITGTRETHTNSGQKDAGRKPGAT